MRRKDFSHMACSIARALDQIGDTWSLLILREAFLGTSRFEQFHSQLGLSKSVLAQRLYELCKADILRKERATDDRRATQYWLTPKGRDLHQVIVALTLWGDKWAFADGDMPIELVDGSTGARIVALAPIDAEGRPTCFASLRARASDAASDEVKARFRNSGQ